MARVLRPLSISLLHCLINWPIDCDNVIIYTLVSTVFIITVYRLNVDHLKCMECASSFRYLENSHRDFLVKVPKSKNLEAECSKIFDYKILDSGGYFYSCFSQ